MLEVKHLKRIYKVKNNDPVYALNDVSLKFQESGLVFILGKSGSGKSTLLNVMGGLDKADEGEIIIEGKSSKEFSSSEMDSYRNTYLGFIFQEYNILSDFTVRENIALALQLQHKKVTEDAIDAILEQVDLVGFGKRKPNELSGGQKQRVAIARALVKEPKIIFGDEPTGALDSKTGKQVFETLKKLSEDKLVVIVSHDRDFAEHFGDRVIELRDGKVISDITKTSVSSKKERDGVSIIGENIVRIDKGHMITADDLPILNKALGEGKEDVYISSDPHVNESFCEAARIDKSGNREEFVDTDPSKLKTGNESFSPIKSHFSLWSAFRMGARSLKVKPFRLVMTILLSTVAFSLFGASEALSTFNKFDATKYTILDGGSSSLTISYTEKGGSGWTDAAIKEVEDGSGCKVYTLGALESVLPVPSGDASDAFHLRRFSASLSFSDNLMNDFGFSLVEGSNSKLPSSSDEAMISLYAYYSYKDLGIGMSRNASGYIAPEQVDYSDVIGSTISVAEVDDSGFYVQREYKISGIYDSSLPTRFAAFREKPTELTTKDSDFIYYASLRQAPNCHNVLIKGKGTASSGSYIPKKAEEVDVSDYSPSAQALLAFGGSDRESRLTNFMKYYFDVREKVNDANWDEVPVGTHYINIDDVNVVSSISTSLMLVVLTRVFLYVGIAMAAFSVLLFYNFMSVSINNKKREIGILRAVGAKKIDVFKVFYSEAFLIAIANFILSTIITFWIASSVNMSFQGELHMPFAVMNANFLTVLLLFGVSIGASIISSILPVTRLACKKPIDAIQNR